MLEKRKGFFFSEPTKKETLAGKTDRVACAERDKPIELQKILYVDPDPQWHPNDCSDDDSAVCRSSKPHTP
ncbi:unnamed protein product [Orchesella dallaii]|uniref:Uncharacterized protein n=1 Tax=Orchesella dallaii TaxID=48710 RepID=A0ABP1R8S8_9HEXA